MVKILLFIKHNLGFVWRIIEWFNGLLFGVLFKKKFLRNLDQLLAGYENREFIYRKISSADLPALHEFFKNQPEESFRFFNPHTFDMATLRRLHNNPAFIMMGVFDQEKMVGYFFFRCFANKKCFIGRIVDNGYRRQGIAAAMNELIYNTIWNSGFRCLSTISKNNTSIYNLHQKGNNIKVLKELDNDYLFVEIVPVANN